MVKFDFDITNFLINLRSPNVSFTGTELYSEAVDFADEPQNMTAVPPLDANGKFPLGGGISSDSIFRVLEPWKIKPYDGTYILDVEGTLITDGGVTLDYDLQIAQWTVGEHVVGQTSGASGIIRTDANNPSLGDGSLIIVAVRGTFEDGETLIGDLGGEASANGAPASVVTSPTTAPDSGNVTIRITAASSGTVAFSEEINNQSFLGRVWIDTQRGASGTSFPKGTPTDPVNNFQDASEIATIRKLNTFNLESELTLLSSDDTLDTDWFGNSHIQSRIVLSGSNSTLTNSYTNMTMEGQFLGAATLVSCHVDAGVDFEGSMTSCVLENTLSLAGGGVTSFVDCVSGVPGTPKVELDYGGTGRDVYFRNWTGGLRLSNKTGPDVMTIDLVAGSVELTNTCTDGTIVIRGIGDLTDNSGANCTVISDGLVNNLELQKAEYNGGVYLDTGNGTIGTTFPIGTPATPAGNIDDALAIATSLGLMEIVVMGGTTVATASHNLDSFSIRAQHGAGRPIISLTGASTVNTSFANSMFVTGTTTGATILSNSSFGAPGSDATFHSGLILDGAIGADTVFLTPGVVGALVSFKDIYRLSGTLAPLTLDCGGDRSVILSRYDGDLILTNLTDAAATVRVHMDGNLTIDSSATNGTVYVAGNANVTDNSAGATVTVVANLPPDIMRRSGEPYKEGIVGPLATVTTVTSDLTESDTDFWKDSFIRFTSGSLEGQVRLVTAYTQTAGSLTVEDMSSAPSPGDTFVLINA